MDVMLLLQMKYALSENLLKGLLSLGTVLYLAGFFWLYQHGNGTQESLPASSGPA